MQAEVELWFELLGMLMMSSMLFGECDLLDFLIHKHLGLEVFEGEKILIFSERKFGLRF